MTDKLNDNDIQRIEQEADIIYDNSPDVLDAYDIVKRLMVEIAEYATLYERRQQAKEKMIHLIDSTKLGVELEQSESRYLSAVNGRASFRTAFRELKIKNEQLEAERSNIETLLHKILKESVGGNVPFSFELYNEIKAALNEK